VCGRYTSTRPPAELAEQFHATEIKAQPLEPNWNVAPTQPVYAVAESRGVRQLGVFRWGLVPSWAPNPAVGARMINARAETVATKPAYRQALSRRRCIVPADAFYEWAASGPSGPAAEGTRRAGKQPYAIARRDGAPLAFAGLWEVWHDPSDPGGAPLRTCVIITTDANDRLRPVHDRMPVVLPPLAWDRWLDRDYHDADALMRLLVPAPADEFVVWPVGRDVNHADANGPELLAPVDAGTGADGRRSPGSRYDS
jgi:putative SOS response-associated peptidase YedK